ncbi:hypothetical protein [Aurantimonas aggregata]|nr:hypothetical protein [Aurantimonas aggregata]
MRRFVRPAGCPQPSAPAISVDGLRIGGGIAHEHFADPPIFIHA